MITSNEEGRLKEAAFCGTIRDTHEMTLVRLSDVRRILESLDYYKSRAILLNMERQSITATKDDALREARELRKVIASTIQSLEAAACAMR